MRPGDEASALPVMNSWASNRHPPDGRAPDWAQNLLDAGIPNGTQ